MQIESYTDPGKNEQKETEIHTRKNFELEGKEKNYININSCLFF